MLTTDEALERVREVVPNGGAVCLVGAGFSTLAKDQTGHGVPATPELTAEIKAAVGVDPDEEASLSDIADYCETNPVPRQKLRNLLLGRLTLSQPSEIQRVIVNQSWRSIFTTNFDDVVERSLPAGSCQVITPATDVETLTSKATPVYHLHGRAADLLETDRDPKFIISETSYLNLPAANRDLYARLKNELFSARLIVILGYSLRDLEIARIVLADGAFREKTVVVCRQSETPLGMSRLQKFGSVLPIGAEGLAEILADIPAGHGASPTSFQFIDEIKSVNPADGVQVDDFVRLILTGAFDRAKFQRQIEAGDESDAYSVLRKGPLEAVLNRTAGGGSRYIVSSDFGNGKTVFLEQLAASLTSSGYRVFWVSSKLNEVFDELSAVFQDGRQAAFLIDDVIRYRDVAEFIGARLNASSILVCGTRADPDDVRFRELTKTVGGASKHIDLNRLTNEELSDWDAALERWGLWEGHIALSSEERLHFLRDECAAENRSIVLSLFRNSRIAARIDAIVGFFLRQSGNDRAFVALLISSLCQKHVSWESLVSWLGIDEPALRRDLSESDVADLFVSGRNWNVFTSAQLAEYILRTRYVPSEKDLIVEVFSTVVLRTAESAGDSALGWEYRENLKELMKFRFLTRLFGDGPEPLKLINTVYRRLSAAPRIRTNPQFWLQYAMSRMEMGDLTNAEAYLNSALGLAQARGKDYSPFQILDQRARLYFRKNAQTADRFSSAEINLALRDLEGLTGENGGITYLYRSVPLIADFLEVHIDRCDAEMKEKMLSVLLGIKAAGEGYKRLPRSQKGETKVLFKAMDDTIRVLRFA
jgi:hypothetical protein